MSFSPDGRMAVVANRNDGTLSVFRVEGQALVKAATVPVGDRQCQPASTAFTPDGATLLVSRDGDHFVSVFDVADGQVRAAGRDISAGIKPYGLSVAPNGRFAVTANVGRVSGDADSISVIDLTRKPYRVVDTLGVAATPEAVVVSPDGAWVVAVCHNGSTRVEDSPFSTRTAPWWCSVSAACSWSAMPSTRLAAGRRARRFRTTAPPCWCKTPWSVSCRCFASAARVLPTPVSGCRSPLAALPPSAPPIFHPPDHLCSH
ncbi:beta-propeller fold lactonase family protein [Polaromonas sp. P1(28)-8]|nr:beta-propeller fold lactonase family protein [Polaromonas sp. P1(28)-8]